MYAHFGLSLFRLTSGLTKIVDLFPYCDTNLKHLIDLGKVLRLYFHNLQKIANLLHLKNVLQVQVIKQKMCKKGPYHVTSKSNMQKYLQHFFKINFYSRKIENVLILFELKGSVQKTMQNFFAKIVQSTFFCSRLSLEL